MNDTVVALLIAVILGCVGIVNAIVVAKSKVDEEVMWAKFNFAYQESLKKIDAVIVQKSTLRRWVKNKKVEIAREIFEEIEVLLASLDIRYIMSDNPKQAWGVRGAITEIVELKKKYLGEDINAPTKESEGE